MLEVGIAENMTNWIFQSVPFLVQNLLNNSHKDLMLLFAADDS